MSHKTGDIIKKLFLGGTCNESSWRDELIKMLEIDYFNPVVDDWTPACMAEEIRQRESCDFCLYVITPKMTGVYSIAEVIDDSNKRPQSVIFCILHDDEGESFNGWQLKSLIQVGKMVERNGGAFLGDLKSIASFVNISGTKTMENKMKKTLRNSKERDAMASAKDTSLVGNTDNFQLLFKASSESEGWMKSTKAMDCGNGCLVQATTQQRNPDGLSYAIAEALSFVPHVKIVPDENNGRKLEAVEFECVASEILSAETKK